MKKKSPPVSTQPTSSWNNGSEVATAIWKKYQGKLIKEQGQGQDRVQEHVMFSYNSTEDDMSLSCRIESNAKKLEKELGTKKAFQSSKVEKGEGQNNNASFPVYRFALSQKKLNKKFGEGTYEYLMKIGHETFTPAPTTVPYYNPNASSSSQQPPAWAPNQTPPVYNAPQNQQPYQPVVQPFVPGGYNPVNNVPPQQQFVQGGYGQQFRPGNNAPQQQQFVQGGYGQQFRPGNNVPPQQQFVQGGYGQNFQPGGNNVPPQQHFRGM